MFELLNGERWQRWVPVPIRIILGVGFVVHGWAKWSRGPAVFAELLKQAHVPLPLANAWLVTLLEIFGGLALLIGAFVAIVSVPLIVSMLGAMFTVNIKYGFSAVNTIGLTAEGPQLGPPGYEINLLYIAGLLALILGGAGPLSIDALRSRRRQGRRGESVLGGTRDVSFNHRTEEMKKVKIVIAGGGFAGLYVAKYLDKTLACRHDVEVILISRENFILFTPMLHEVAAGDLYPGDIVNPLRRILRHVKIAEVDVKRIDLDNRLVRCTGGVANGELGFAFDHLLLTLGSETNFFGMHDLRDRAVTMKNLSDAALLRNRVVTFLEQASLERDEAARRALLTFVTAGGGFSGAETTGAINDFVRETVRYYPQLSEELIRVVVVHPGSHLLPEFDEELGRYAEHKLRERKVEVIKGARVASYDGWLVRLSDGTSINAATLIWTAGVKPGACIASLPHEKEKGRLRVNEYLAVPGLTGVWAAGDCAAVPDVKTGKFHPPTAQHGLREGLVAAKNIKAAILGRPLKPFVFTTLGQLATIGRRTGVAKVFGIKFSGFIAWWLWRTIYLAKLPRLAKKLRVMMSWTLDLLFGAEIDQQLAVHDVEALTNLAARVRARAKQGIRTAEKPVPTA